MNKRILKKLSKRYVMETNNYITEEIRLGADVSMLGVPDSQGKVWTYPNGSVYDFDIKQYLMSNRGHWCKCQICNNTRY